MGTISNLEIIKLLQEKNISLFTLSDFSHLLDLDNQNTIYKKIQRLEKKGIIKQLIKGRYLFSFLPNNDFTIANFLYQPSYISLESALSFYGIITGFPYQITSITTKKPRKFTIDGKEFIYSKIGQDYFWGYEKKEDFLIADREKALFDYLYFSVKGLRRKDFDEFDLSEINKQKLKYYLKETKNRTWSKLIANIKI